MGIRTGGFAYYFCNPGELSAFIKRYGNKISNVDGMLYVYHTGKLSWTVWSKKYVKAKGLKILVYTGQRSE